VQEVAKNRHHRAGAVKPAKLTLPVCRWREKSVRGRYTCHSTRFLGAPNQVSAQFCEACSYADRDPPPLCRVLPCVHLGGFTGEYVQRDGSLQLPVSACAVHGRCTLGAAEAEGPGALPACENCTDYLARDPFGPDSAQMGSKADAFLAAVPKYPKGRYKGRGVVIAGGGDRYFASLYVTIRALRHVGCRLPIQVWYLGRLDEMPAEKQAILAPYGVECVDADEVRLRHPARMLNGWELKVFATLHSPFEEILFLDADCYPCRRPDFLFGLDDYREHGAIFWPDMATFDERLKWPAFGVPDPQRPGSVESGQYVVHKRLAWQPLNLAWFYNDHSDYYYRYCYGDKHTFEVAWARCGRPFAMWQPHAQWWHVAYVHPGPDGRPLFVHRCADKFRIGRQDYVTEQVYEGPVFHADLPLERECWGWMGELAQIICNTLDLPHPREDRNEPTAPLPLA
jgi:Mannosyltransferase putative